MFFFFFFNSDTAVECLARCVLAAGKASVVREPHSILPSWHLPKSFSHLAPWSGRDVGDSHGWHHPPFFPLRTGQATSWLSPPSWAISWQSPSGQCQLLGSSFQPHKPQLRLLPSTLHLPYRHSMEEFPRCLSQRPHHLSGWPAILGF